MTRIVSFLFALALIVATPFVPHAHADLAPTTIFAVRIDQNAPVNIGDSPYRLPNVGGWNCAVGPMQGNSDFAVRSLVCGRKDLGLGFAVTAGCARHTRDTDVQRLTIGDKNTGATFLLVCMTDRFQES